MELLIFCIQVSLACLAIHVAICHQGMILNFLYEPAKLLTEEWLYKPLFDCMMCMASFWTLIFWLAYDKPFTFDFIFSVLVVSGFNKLICSFLEKATDYGC